MSHAAAEPARLVFDSLPSAVLVLGRGGNVLHANRAAEALLGTPLTAIRGHRPDEVWAITNEDGTPLTPSQQLGMAAIDSAEPEHGTVRRLRTPDGRWLHVEVEAVPSLGADGRPYQVVCTVTDVTERRRVEAKVRQSEREWRQLFQSAGIGIARLDLRGRVQRANPLLHELLGYDHHALEGKTLHDLVLPEDIPNLSFPMLAELELPRVESDVRYLRRDGQPVWVHSVVTLVRDGQGRPTSLVNTVEDISGRKAREAELEHRILHDLLTGLPNRALLNDRLVLAIRSARRSGAPAALIAFDVDGLREVNETHGHAVGDSVLVEVAERAKRTVRRSDTVARLGGDEFAILLSVGGADTAEPLMRKLEAALSAPFAVDGSTLQLGCSLGLAVYPADGEDAGSLFQSADLAMLTAKRARSGGRRRAPASTEAIDRRVALLERVSMLTPLGGDDIRRLARRMTELTVAAGTVLNQPGTPATTLLVIESGACEVLAGERPLLLLGPGDLVGTSLIIGAASNATVRATDECRLLEIDGEALRGLLPPESEVYDELRRVAAQRQEMLSRLVARATSGAGTATRMIAVYSPKGGSGKTTIALNLAAALARAHPEDVLLIDLALPFNHAALLATLSPTTCLARVGHHDAHAFPMALQAGILRHSAGFMVLSTALRPEEADLITAELVTRAVDVAGREFSYIVFDLGAALSDPVLAVLDRSDQVVPVITPELTSMKDCAQFLEILTDVLHVPDSAVHLLVNHRTPESGMTRGDVERVLERPVAIEVTYDGARPEQAALRGEVMALSQPRSGLARGTVELAGALTAAPGRQPARARGRAAWRSYVLG